MLKKSPSLAVPPVPCMRGVVGRSCDAQPILFQDLAPGVRTAVLRDVLDDRTPVEWSEEDIVFLHWRLLQELAALGHPATPLEDKLDTLRWVFTEPEREHCPFSFANCLRVIGCSPLSPAPYIGRVDAELMRGWIRHHARTWLHATVARYPRWVQDAILQHPGWIEHRLATNPQWINEAIRRHTVQRDLFV